MESSFSFGQIAAIGAGDALGEVALGKAGHQLHHLGKGASHRADQAVQAFADLEDHAALAREIDAGGEIAGGGRVGQHGDILVGALQRQFRFLLRGHVAAQRNDAALGGAPLGDAHPTLVGQAEFDFAVAFLPGAQAAFQPLGLAPVGVGEQAFIEPGLQDFPIGASFDEQMRLVAEELTGVFGAEDQPVFLVIEDDAVAENAQGIDDAFLAPRGAAAEIVQRPAKIGASMILAEGQHAARDRRRQREDM